MRRESFSRFNFVGGVLTIAALVIFAWVIRLQNGPEKEELIHKKNIQEKTRKIIYPERGNIYDRWGHLLAGNMEVYEIGVDRGKEIDKESIMLTLSSVLNMNAEDYNHMRTMLYPETEPALGVRSYVPLAKFVDPLKVAEIQRAAKLMDEQAATASKPLFGKKGQSMPNLHFLEYSPMLKRSYPEGSLASNILGFYPYFNITDAVGNYGIEAQYDDLLGGKPVEVQLDNDPNNIQDLLQIPAGASLVLTIDREIQAMAEDVLDQSLENNGAEGGTIIIMEPETGEILAMAVQPRMNLNEYWLYGDIYKTDTEHELPFNRAIGTTYEPGSVFKVLTMAAALDAGAVTPETVMLDTGTFWIGGVAIHNWDRGARGPVDMTACMRYSLNVCLSWIANELGPTRFYDYMHRFGIGQQTRIDLAGEGNFPLAIPGDANWYEVNLGTNSFGQGVAVTPIQLLTAINAVPNHGKMVAPHLVRSVIQDGEERQTLPSVIGTPISASAADTLSEMLAVSIEEEGNKPGIEGYRIAGKTGTAEIPSPNGYVSNVTNASFVGWGPVDDPRFIVYIWFEKPTSDIWGSTVAAPVFKEVLGKLVVLMDIPPDAVRQGIANNP
jgi:cell division protein FtsI/penicillin-binding protein 2